MLYLSLFHGRESKDEQVEDQGFQGPCIGPLRYCHTTYAAEIKLQFRVFEDVRNFLLENRDMRSGYGELHVEQDLVAYGGDYYGDWSACDITPQTAARINGCYQDSQRRRRDAELLHTVLI